MALIFAGSSIPRTPRVASGMSDKVLHVVVYGGLGALIVRAFAGGWRRPVTFRMVMYTVLIATAYGISDEYHQRFVPHRDTEALDVVADLAGAAIASSVLYAWGIIRRRDGL
jgi:VanZ family protein